MTTFDPDGAATHDGIYGLPHGIDEARVVVVPVPFDATTSYRDGTRNGPAAVLEASRQVDLHDMDFGDPWRAGIAMLPLAGKLPRDVARLNRRARPHAEKVLAVGGRVEGRPQLVRALDLANDACGELNAMVHAEVAAILQRGQIPLLLGGDHATPFGAIQACAELHPGLGILHVDAHADLRDAYEGFTWSHASIMNNVVTRIPSLDVLVQVGLRDLGGAEHAMIRERRGKGTPRRVRPAGARIAAFFDAELQGAKHRGRSWVSLCRRIVGELPRRVYVSVDVDGLDPRYCPDTGTPVPGGLDFAELVTLLRTLVASGRRIVGGDLNEVAPSPRSKPADWGADWNANVGARLLYKLAGAILASQATRRRASGGRGPGASATAPSPG